MNTKEEQERLEEDAPKRYDGDRQGQKVMATFGASLTFAALVILAAIAIIWWLASR